MQLLEQERERGRLAEAELRVLRRQLRREKTTFENASVVCTHNTSGVYNYVHFHYVPSILLFSSTVKHTLGLLLFTGTSIFLRILKIVV